MSLISIKTFEHLIEGRVVSYKRIKFCGIPLYTSEVESSNYNWVGQFDANNFTTNKPKVEEEHIPLYTETNIGFNSHDKETEETAIQPTGVFRKSTSASSTYLD